MSAIQRFQRVGMADAARQLELHPFEVVRILVADGSLPSSLRLEPADLQRVRMCGGLETWWEAEPYMEGAETMSRALIRGLLRRMVERGCIEPSATRADNLFRGLAKDHQASLRRSVNALIKEGVLFSQMTATGLTVGVRVSHLDDARAFALSGTGPLDRLWDQD